MQPNMDMQSNKWFRLQQLMWPMSNMGTYDGFLSLLVCLWWWWWCTWILYVLCAAGWHNAWLALFCSSSSDWLSVLVAPASIVLCTKLTNERNGTTKAVDVEQIKMVCCEEEEACYVVMLCYMCYAHRLCRHIKCVNVGVDYTLNSHEPKRKHATRSILSLYRNLCTVWIVNVWPLRGRFSPSSAFARISHFMDH